MIDSNTQLLQALQAGDLVAVKAALKNGADPGVRNAEETAINTAITNGQSAIVQTLIASGLSPNGTDEGEMPPLVVAAYGESENAIEIVDILINAGADPNCVWREESQSPLITAIEARSDFSYEIIERLISAGADLEQARGDGFRPLHLAVSNAAVSVARKLLEAGAIVSAKRIGHSEVDAISVAEFKGNVEMLSLLKEFGAHDISVSKNLKIADIWSRIIAGFSGVPELTTEISKETTTEDSVIAQVEAALDASLAADVVAQWERMGEGCRFGIWEYELLSAEHARDRMISLNKISNENQWETLEPKELDLSRGEVVAQWWNRGWVPIAQDGGGNLICIDHAPGVMGVRGQVILWEIHAGPVGPIANSWLEYLEEYLSKIESGRWTYDEGSLFED